MCIYYINYDKNPFYLVIDDLQGYFERLKGLGSAAKNEYNKYLTLIVKSQRQKIIYIKIWEEIKKLINEVDDNKFSDYNKDYGIISLEKDDFLPLNSIINIYSMTTIIRSVFKYNNKFYPQIYLNNCSYSPKNV